MEKIVFEQVPDLFEQVGSLFLEKKEELCEMDAKLGDGDLGLTMSKGYGALPELLRTEGAAAGGDIGKMLMKAGMKMSSLVPSTMGFLMSSGVMEGGKALKGKTATLESVLGAALDGARAGVEATREMVPVFGKAAVHAAQSAGVADQGAVAGCYMVQGLYDYIKKCGE